MRLYPDKLEQHLQKQLLPIYLLSGDEPLQLGECADAVRRQARARGYSAREVLVADSNFDWTQLNASANTLSLFAERRILELRMDSGKPGREGGKALKVYAERPADNAILLITSGKIDKASQSSAWYKALDKVGANVQIWPLAAGDLASWISQRMRSKNLHCNREAATLIAERVEGNMLAAQQEIDKMALLYAGEEIGVDTLSSVVANSARYHIFDLADAALAGQALRATAILEKLRAEDIHPVAILCALSTQIATVTQLAHAQVSGKSLSQAMRDARIWQSRQSLYEQALKRWGPSTWNALLARCAELELLSKGHIQGGNVWDALLSLALQVAGGFSLDKLLSPLDQPSLMSQLHL